MTVFVHHSPIRRYDRATAARVLLLFLAPVIAAIACAAPSSSQIVFVSDINGNFDLYSVPSQGGEVTNLTNTASDETNPVLSPDRKAIAFQVSNGADTSLETLELVNTTRTVVSAGPGKRRFQKWSPNNRRLAYVLEDEGGTEIRVADADGSKSLIITEIPGNEIGDWSKNGDSIVFSVRSGEPRGIWIRNPDGVNEDRLTETPDYNPSWSPDSSRLAFVSTRDGNPEIYAVNADGSEQVRLTNNMAAEYGVSWSPNGRKLLFVSERDGNPEIYVMNVDGSEQARLTRNSTTDDQPAWSPDGQHIAFVSYLDGDGEIFVMRQDGSAQTRLTNNTAQDTSPAW